MSKKKNKDLVEEQGVGYIKVTAKVKKGAVTEWYTSKFGFASVYMDSDLRNAAGKIKEIVIRVSVMRTRRPKASPQPQKYFIPRANISFRPVPPKGITLIFNP